VDIPSAFGNTLALVATAIITPVLAPCRTSSFGWIHVWIVSFPTGLILIDNKQSITTPSPNDGIVTLLPFDRLLLVTQTNELISYL